MNNKWEDLEKLEENWDSYHGAPTTAKAITAGKLIESLLSIPIQFFPTADGGVSFEWARKVNDNNWESLVIDVDPEGEVSIYLG